MSRHDAQLVIVVVTVTVIVAVKHSRHSIELLLTTVLNHWHGP